MNVQTSRPVAAVIHAAFETYAGRLRDRGESAAASLNELPSGQFVVALEVARNRRDWQRNLIVTLDPAASPQIDVRLLDDDQSTVVEIGDASVPDESTADVALALARAGIVYLLSELRLTPIAV